VGEKERTTIYIDKDLRKKVKLKAVQEEISMTELFTKAVKEYLKKESE